MTATNFHAAVVISDATIMMWSAELMAANIEDDPSLEGEFYLPQWKQEASSSSNIMSKIALDAALAGVGTCSPESSPEVESKLKLSRGFRGRKRANIQNFISLNLDVYAVCSLHNSNTSTK